MNIRNLIDVVETMYRNPLLAPRLLEDDGDTPHEDAAARKLFDDIVAGHSESALWLLKHEIGIGEEDRFDFQNHSDEIMEWCRERVSDAFSEIDHRIRGGTIRCWRVITAPKDWVPSGHPGVYWSWDRDAAEAHWGNYSDGYVPWEITADIPSSSIDMTMSLVMNAHPDYEDEREVRIFKDAPVKIVSTRRL